MTIEIRTSTLEPVRNTFEHIKRRFLEGDMLADN